ncbi:1,4-dihydroxy-2-naphthoate octaprenyltransferase [Enterococcus sp. DIV0212c]|uniref:prenyltransferase n=1 Tax=Enterococcus sp. DIV0212c TaxID=2230867 RepID=UPI001A9B8ABB|nr:prenyltransferase [Enterococcus sp. DIV0212c]MBO1353000.1 prenyltransferase [Enterococcus sp. DIV0212c]
MTRKILWELGEIYTTPLDWFLVLLGMAYSGYTQGSFFNWRLLIFLVVLFLYHITMNIFNNYMDFQNAKDDHYKQQTSTISKWNLSLKIVKRTFLFFLFISLFFGAILVFSTDSLVLILGILGYYVGFGYSYGRRPINSLPIAETIPAVLSGFMIPIIGAYLANYGTAKLTFHSLGGMLIGFMPMFFCMFNNLLANNTCDLEEDIKNGRKTLVYYIGKKNSVSLLILLTCLSYISIIAAVYFKQAPVLTLGIILLFPTTLKILRPYFRQQIKKQTFPLVLKGMSLIMFGYPVVYLIGSFIQL